MSAYANVQCRIIEEPCSTSQRFRYDCESRFGGSIPGCTSTTKERTYPTIQITNFIGQVVVVVSCVSAKLPHYAHPNQLTGKNAKYGCVTRTAELTKKCNIIKFHGMCIQCVKKAGVTESLELRESKRIDPFKVGFKHMETPLLIDLKVVRLCFQVFLRVANKSDNNNLQNVPIPPILSVPIFDRRYICELNICNISDSFGSADGGKKIMIFCEKVNKNDIAVRFIERDEDGNEVWSAVADPSTQIVHHQVAIAIVTPPYRDDCIEEPTKNVSLELLRPSDGLAGTAIKFTYTTVAENVTKLQCMKRKRREECQSRELRQMLNANLNELVTNANDKPETTHINQRQNPPVQAQRKIKQLELEHVSNDFRDPTPPLQPTRVFQNNLAMHKGSNGTSSISNNPFLCQIFHVEPNEKVSNTLDSAQVINAVKNEKCNDLSKVDPQRNYNNPFLQVPANVYAQTLTSLHQQTNLPVLNINSKELVSKTEYDAAPETIVKDALSNVNVISAVANISSAIFKAENGKEYHVLSAGQSTARSAYNNNPFLKDMSRDNHPNVYENTLSSLQQQVNLPVLDINSNELTGKHVNDQEFSIISSMTVSFNSLEM